MKTRVGGWGNQVWFELLLGSVDGGTKRYCKSQKVPMVDPAIILKPREQKMVQTRGERS